jgi:hypothetical protein
VARKRAADRPTILVVDDKIEDARLKIELFDATVKVEPRVPADVTKGDLQAAAVVLVDLFLTDWTQGQAGLPIAQIPEDGLALIAVLRSHCDPGWPPTAFALHSGQVNQIGGQLPRTTRMHLVARANNLDWVFSKLQAENVQPIQQQVAALAKAVAALPAQWPPRSQEDSRKRVGKLLGLRRLAAWTDRAWESVQACRPPIHDLATVTHGLSFVRWLLHTILPYPTFLWDDRYVAARLRVTPASFRAELERHGKAWNVLKPALYTGVLSDFLGRRWWRVGIEDLLWEATKAESFGSDSIAKFTRSLSRRLVPVGHRQPVVALDEELAPLDELVSLSDVAQIFPDGWPQYADPAWATKDRIADEAGLRALAAPRREGEV